MWAAASAGGRRYLHINANGDCDPCVFIHYSDSNIREKTLLEALRSPCSWPTTTGSPSTTTTCVPCPMLENPEKLREIVHKSGAHPSDVTAVEEVDDLCAKCDSYAENCSPLPTACGNAPTAVPPARRWLRGSNPKFTIYSLLFLTKIVYYLWLHGPEA